MFVSATALGRQTAAEQDPSSLYTKVSGRRAKASHFFGIIIFFRGGGRLTEEPWEENLIFVDKGFGVSFEHFHSEGSLKRPPPQLVPSSRLYSAKQTRLPSTCATSDLFKEEEGRVSLSVAGSRPRWIV